MGEEGLKGPMLKSPEPPPRTELSFHVSCRFQFESLLSHEFGPYINPQMSRTSHVLGYSYLSGLGRFRV